MENITPKKVPTHVSIIMDGNGRWAAKRGRERSFGHIAGAETVERVAEACRDRGIKYLSVYAFSEENWNRPKDEVDTLMKLLADTISNKLQKMIDNGTKLIVIGNREKLGDLLNSMIDFAVEKTSGNDRTIMVVFFSYSGRWDILQAAKRFALENADNPDAIKNATLDDFSHYLATDGIPEPDLLIRTSGEQRISNYLLWQAAYTEFYFTPVLWPDFGEEELDKALLEYSLRDRRYGKVK